MSDSAEQEAGATLSARLSLSRTAAVQFAQIEALVQQLRLTLSPTRRQGFACAYSDCAARPEWLTKGTCSFALALAGWEVLSNDQGTRSFLAVRVSVGHRQASPDQHPYGGGRGLYPLGETGCAAGVATALHASIQPSHASPCPSFMR